jgi:hypothetical protein
MSEKSGLVSDPDPEPDSDPELDSVPEWIFQIRFRPGRHIPDSARSESTTLNRSIFPGPMKLPFQWHTVVLLLSCVLVLLLFFKFCQIFSFVHCSIICRPRSIPYSPFLVLTASFLGKFLAWLSTLFLFYTPSFSSGFLFTYLNNLFLSKEARPESW